MSGGDTEGLDDGPSSSTFDPGGAEHTWVGDDEPSAKVLTERYLVDRELGRGAIGVVERVFDAHLERTVARKRLLDDRPASRKRFIREARTTASLAHPGIPPVFDLGADADVPYYTMQEIVGRPWKQLIKEAGDLEARLAQLDILLAVARAVAHAHEHDLVHRDLKLDNVMIGPLGDVFVVDWGLCVPVGHEGPLAGTPQYMSPEQARGEPTTKECDVWALGVLLFRLLAVHAPYPGPSGAEVVEQAKAGQIRDVTEAAPEAPPELIDMIRKATDIDPDARYPDAAAFAADLRAFLQGNWVTAHDYTVRELLEKLFARHKRRLAVGGTVGAVVIAGVLSGGWVVLEQRDRARAAVAERQEQLAIALEDRAAAARADRWEPAAEVAAAQALQIDPDRPRAWGVLARHALTDHPTLAWSTTLPCPAVSGDERRILLDCPHAFSIADLDANGTLGSVHPLVLPTLGAGDESVRHALAGDLVARWGGASQDAVLNLATDQPIALPPSMEPWAEGTREGEPGLLLRGSEGPYWMPASDPSSPPLFLGPTPPGQIAALDVDGVLISSATHGLYRCTGLPLVCALVVSTPGISQLTTDGGWVATEAVGSGLQILDPSVASEGDPYRTLPVDAGAYTQLQIVDGFVAALRTEGDVDVWTLDARPVARLPTRSLHPTHLGRQGQRLLVLGERIDAWDLGAMGHTRRATTSGALTHLHGAHVSVEDDRLALLTEPPIQGPAFGAVAKSIDTSPDGIVWAAQAMGSITRWNPSTGAAARIDVVDHIRRLVAVPEGGVLAMDYGKRVHRVHDDGTVHQATSHCWGDMARSADGSVVVCGHHNRLLQLDPSTGAEVAELARQERALWALAVSPAGERVAYATDDHVIAEVNLSDGTTRTVGPDHDSFVSAMAYSPDGRWLATASWDQRVHVYDAATLHLTAILAGHQGRVVGLDFATPSILGSIGWEQVLWRWDLSVIDQRPEEHLRRVASEVGGRIGPSER